MPIEKIRACDFIDALALNIPAIVDGYFTAGDGLQPDGSREGVLRNQNCSNALTAYIPTPVAAQANLAGSKMALAISGAFKIPTLRNVELTGPYMHNGGMATLAQVIEFYTRHGNFTSEFESFNMGATSNQLSATKNAGDLINFLLALTDERVRYQRAPFDHPQLIVNHGHAGNSLQVEAGNPLSAVLAVDELLVIPAIGASGAAAPITPFLAP